MNKAVDSISRWMRRGYGLFFAIIFVLYVAAAALPPLWMHQGHETAARIGYWGYQHLCHQLPYRSFFLFGEQPAYPLEEAKIDGPVSYERMLAETSEHVPDVRRFIGNEKMGYKMALCQRDVAIFLSMALFCLIYYASGNRIPGISWILWGLIGILPMGLDGGTQLLSRMTDALPVRESTPALRILTGVLFGIMTCWFLFPRLENSLADPTMDENSDMEEKIQ